MTEGDSCDDVPTAASFETAADASLLESAIDALSLDENEEEVDMSESYSLDNSLESLGTSSTSRPNAGSEVYKSLFGIDRL
jgi:hypothetical protein